MRRFAGLAAALPAGLVFAGLFAAPLAYFLVISFWSVRARMMRVDFTLANYLATWRDYGDVLGNTLLIAGIIGLVTTAIAFCFACLYLSTAGGGPLSTLYRLRAAPCDRLHRPPPPGGSPTCRRHRTSPCHP